MAICVLLDFNVKDDQVDNMKQWMTDNLPDTRQRPGAGAITMLCDQDDPTHFVIHEIWDSKDDQQAYVGWRQERGDLEVLGAMFAGPPSFTFYDMP